jgi:hypothetical protein
VSKTKLEKWTHRKFNVRRPAARVLVEEFHRVLGDAADERPLQAYFAAQPTLLAPLVPLGSGYWCLDRPQLGAELVPDFLLASRSSAGFRWAMIELEGPNERALTKAGLPARKLAEALKQVRDWRACSEVTLRTLVISSVSLRSMPSAAHTLLLDEGPRWTRNRPTSIASFLTARQL